MKTDDKTEFVTLLTELSAYYEKNLRDFAVKVWWKAMGELSIEEFTIAVEKAICEFPFFPTPNQVLGLAHGDRNLLAGQQWAKAMGEIANGVRLTDSQLDPYAKAAIADLGGLYTLGILEESKLHWKEKEFKELYISYQKSGVKLLPVVETRSQPTQRFEGMKKAVSAPPPSEETKAYVISELAKLGVKVEVTNNA